MDSREAQRLLGDTPHRALAVFAFLTHLAGALLVLIVVGDALLVRLDRISTLIAYLPPIGAVFWVVRYLHPVDRKHAQRLTRRRRAETGWHRSCRPATPFCWAARRATRRPIPGPHVRRRTLRPVYGGQRNGRMRCVDRTRGPKRQCRNSSAAWVIHGTWLSPRPSQECDPHSVNSNGPRPNRQGWKSSQFSPPTRPDWVSFGSSRRIAVLHDLPRSHGPSVAFPKLRALRPSTKDT
jgi:hypothetical protein